RSEILQISNQNLEKEVEERRGAEEALRTSERRNRTLIDATTSVVWSADGMGRFVERQQSWENYTGQSFEQHAGSHWLNAFAPEDQNNVELAWRRAITQPATFDLEVRLWNSHSRAYRFVSLRAVPLIETPGEVSEWIGTVADIDDQRHAEQELRTLN